MKFKKGSQMHNKLLQLSSLILIITLKSISGFGNQNTLWIAIKNAGEFFDPVKTVTANSLIITNALTRGLVRLNRDGIIISDLAKKWNISDDLMSYTFYLDTKAKFHDGTFIHAEDVAISISRHFWKKDISAIDNILVDSLGGRLGLKKGEILPTIKIVNKNTLKINLKQRLPTFLHILATPAYGVLKEKEGLLIGTGSLSGSYNTKDKIWELKRFDDLASKSENVPNLINIYSDLSYNDMREKIKNKKLDLAIGYAESPIVASEINSEYELQTTETFNIIDLFLNHENLLFKNIKFRQDLGALIRFAIDEINIKDPLIKRNFSFLPEGILPSEYYNHLRPKLTPEEFKIKYPTLSKKPLNIILREDILLSEERTRFINYLESAGISCQVKIVDLKKSLEYLKRGDYDLILLSFFAITPTPDGLIPLISPHNEWKPGRKKFEIYEKILSIRSIVDEQDRRQKYVRAFIDFDNSSMIIPLFRSLRPLLKKKSIFIPDTFYRTDFHLADLRISK